MANSNTGPNGRCSCGGGGSSNEKSIARLMYAMLKQKSLKDINWDQVAHDPVLLEGISNGHAARMRFARFRATVENTRKPRATRQSSDPAVCSNVSLGGAPSFDTFRVAKPRQNSKNKSLAGFSRFVALQYTPANTPSSLPLSPPEEDKMDCLEPPHFDGIPLFATINDIMPKRSNTASTTSTASTVSADDAFHFATATTAAVAAAKFDSNCNNGGHVPSWMPAQPFSPPMSIYDRLPADDFSVSTYCQQQAQDGTPLGYVAGKPNMGTPVFARPDGTWDSLLGHKNHDAGPGNF